MRLAFLKDLTGNEVLARDIITSYGETLLKKGKVLTTDLREKIENQGMFFVYVEDDIFSDIMDDTVLLKLKNNVLKSLPNMFNDIICCNKGALNKSLALVDELVDYIENEKYINLNLYEVKMYDDYTYIHSVDTSIMATFLGVNMNLPKENLRELAIAALFHDIGKTKISSGIINKPTRLTDKEFEEIKLHPVYGRKILSRNPEFSNIIIDAVTAHHEKYNGEGYPLGLEKSEIPIYARFISVCDVFTAITADRCYRKKFAPKEAYELILSETYTSFDPDVIHVFQETFAVYPLGCPVHLSNGYFGYVIRQNSGLPDRPVVRVVKDELNRKIPPYEIDLKKVINIIIE